MNNQSSSMINKLSVSQNLEMASQHSTTAEFSSRYKFNAKELDQETGWYYYGARYYDPSVSQWMSVDPLLEKYPAFNPYNYTLNNPIMLVDPDGRTVDTDFKLDKNGKVTRVDPKDNSDKDKSDTLYATDENGNVNKNKSITVQKKEATDSTVISKLAETMSDKVEFGTTKNLNDAAKVFIFGVNNSNVEFGLDSYKGKFYVHTKNDHRHNTNFEANYSLFGISKFYYSKYDFSVHSHKGGANTPSKADKRNGLKAYELGARRLQKYIYKPYYNSSSNSLRKYFYKGRELNPTISERTVGKSLTKFINKLKR